MRLEPYELSADVAFTTFEFLSVGPKGKIIKSVQFQPTRIPNVYNLAFGNKNVETGEIDDKVVTDNGDKDKVPTTVIDALYTFAKYFPNSWIYATGSTPARTRLYRMGINKYFDIDSADFDILGDAGNHLENMSMVKIIWVLHYTLKPINLIYENN